MSDHDDWQERYRVEPEAFWRTEHGSGVGGYDMIGEAAGRGWHAIGSWGEDGWNLGAWPYVIVFGRGGGDRWEIAYYIEGDVVTYAFPDQARRDAAIDGKAYWYWSHRDEDWVRPYRRAEMVPPALRGPYGVERLTTPKLLRALRIPVSGPAEVWYVREDLETLSAILGGPLEGVQLGTDAHLYCHEEGKIVGKPVNEPASWLWRRAYEGEHGGDLLAGTVLVLGCDGVGEADCPQWTIDLLGEVVEIEPR